MKHSNTSFPWAQARRAVELAREHGLHLPAGVSKRKLTVRLVELARREEFPLGQVLLGGVPAEAYLLVKQPVAPTAKHQAKPVRSIRISYPTGAIHCGTGEKSPRFERARGHDSIQKRTQHETRREQMRFSDAAKAGLLQLSPVA